MKEFSVHSKLRTELRMGPDRKLSGCFPFSLWASDPLPEMMSPLDDLATYREAAKHLVSNTNNYSSFLVTLMGCSEVLWLIFTWRRWGSGFPRAQGGGHLQTLCWVSPFTQAIPFGEREWLHNLVNQLKPLNCIFKNYDFYDMCIISPQSCYLKHKRK